MLKSNISILEEHPIAIGLFLGMLWGAALGIVVCKIVG